MHIPKYIEDYRNELTRKGFSLNTVKNYTDCLSIFLRKFDGIETEPKRINEDQIREYLGTFKSRNTQRAMHGENSSFGYFCIISRPKRTADTDPRMRLKFFQRPTFFSDLFRAPTRRKFSALNFTTSAFLLSTLSSQRRRSSFLF